VRAVAELRDEDALGPLKTALPATGIMRVADDKAATQEALRAAGVPVPETVTLEGEASLEEAFHRFSAQGAPVWVRGAGAPGLGIGGAALPCRDVSVARAWVEHHGGWGKMAASEYLPGANLTWMAAFQAGELVVAAARERLEYVLPHVSPSGITGAPAVSRTISRRDVSAIGERAVRAIDPEAHGVYFVDLKEDQQGEPRVTEINAGRCGTTVHFYTSAGLNFPELLARMALGLELPVFPDPQDVVPVGRYWVRTLDCGPVLVDSDASFDDYPTLGIS